MREENLARLALTRRRRALEVAVGILLVAVIWSAFAAVWPLINPLPASAPDVHG